MNNQHIIGDTVKFITSVQNWDKLNKQWIQFEYGEAEGTVFSIYPDRIEVLANYGLFTVPNRLIVS